MVWCHGDGGEGFRLGLEWGLHRNDLYEVPEEKEVNKQTRVEKDKLRTK